MTVSCGSLGLPDRALAELRSKLESMAALPLAGAPAHLEALLADILQGTYFRMESGHLLYLTRRGSRPGNPCADVLFSFLLTAYFDAVDRVLQQRGMQAQLPAPRTSPVTGLHRVRKTLGFLSWGDDCLQCHMADRLAAVLAVAKQVLQVSIDVAASLGILFSFAPTKTCIMVPRQRSPLAQIAADVPLLLQEDASVNVHSEVLNETYSVQIVPVYKHLGCVLTCDRASRSEILFRHAQAVAVARPLARQFFAASQYPLHIRRYMLRSLVMSRYVHGSVALTLRTKLDQRQWNNFYISLWRTLCRRDHATKKHAHAYEVLCWAQAPSPPLALAYARAVFLQRHVTTGPSEVFQLLQVHWETDPEASWLHQLLRDIRIVQLYVPAVQVLQGTSCPIRSLLDSLDERPGWWVQCVRRAQA